MRRKKYYTISEKYIKKVIRQTKKSFLNYYGLENVIVKYTDIGNCSLIGYINLMDNSLENAHIEIDLTFLILSMTKKYKMHEVYKINGINSVKKKIQFAILHELGHYLHAKKYCNSFEIENEAEKGLKKFVDYRQLPTEKKADTLARAFIKKFY